MNPIYAPNPDAKVYQLDNGMQVRLGAILDPATMQHPRLHFGDFLYQESVAPPDDVDYGAKAQAALAKIYGNDRYGDCVMAGKGHMFGVWTGNETGTPVIATDDEILAQYHGICGPGDNGCDPTAVADYILAHGFTMAGKVHHIDGYVGVDNTNKTEVMVAIYLLGALDVSLNLPSSWPNSPVWDVTSDGIEGGHCIPAIAYAAKDGVTIATWGGTRLMTWAAFLSTDYIVTCLGMLSPDWYSVGNKSPIGINRQALDAAMAALKANTLPVIPPAVIPWNWDEVA